MLCSAIASVQCLGLLDPTMAAAGVHFWYVSAFWLGPDVGWQLQQRTAGTSQ
jgi:hypothetical protein